MFKIAVLHRYPIAQVLGTNASFLEFIKELTNKGNKVLYVTYKDTHDRPIIKNLEYVELPFYFNRGNNFDKVFKTYLWIFLAPIYVFILQIKNSLDLVYCDDSVPYYGFISKLISPWSKVVIRLGDLQSGYLFADSHPKIFRLAIILEKMMWRHVDGLVAISKPFKDYIVGRGIDENKISIVEESINLSKIETAKNSISNQVFTLLFHGALLKCKGLEVLLKAKSILDKKFPGKFKLIIAGGGSQEDELKRLVKSLNLRDVFFTGWYDHKKLTDIMKDVDISIVMRSTNMANNFVVTTCLLENWAFLKPVIAPNLQSFKRVINSGVNGVLFEAGNPNDLAEKIYEVSNNDLRNQAMAQVGYKTALEKFDHKFIAHKMVSVLLKYAEE